MTIGSCPIPLAWGPQDELGLAEPEPAGIWTAPDDVYNYWQSLEAAVACLGGLSGRYDAEELDHYLFQCYFCQALQQKKVPSLDEWSLKNPSEVLEGLPQECKDHIRALETALSDKRSYVEIGAALRADPEYDRGRSIAMEEIDMSSDGDKDLVCNLAEFTCGWDDAMWGRWAQGSKLPVSVLEVMHGGQPVSLEDSHAYWEDATGDTDPTPALLRGFIEATVDTDTDDPEGD